MSEQHQVETERARSSAAASRLRREIEGGGMHAQGSQPGGPIQEGAVAGIKAVPLDKVETLVDAALAVLNRTGSAGFVHTWTEIGKQIQAAL